MEWGWGVEFPKSLENFSDQNDGECGYSVTGFLEEHDGSVLSGEEMIGLNLGRQTCCQEKSMYLPVKRARGGSYHHSSLLPRCQVEGCDLDLSSAKDYHRRHRICADHSKSPKVVVAGMERRFCQQCSRQVLFITWLHDLSEFDDRKRSCRRRLSAHNARRRRPPSEDMRLISTHRRGAHMGLLNGGLSGISSSINGITPRRVNHDGLEANSSSINGMEVHHSFPLEATSSWGFRGREEPSSFDQFIHGHNIGLMQPGVPLELQSTRNTQIPNDNFDCFCSN
ncbi:hypothetical protein M8C21_020816 [Ambrosia artemisiifolia]|uniref:SBP-type domain-containing protein n=1 Tax=Ambrosia artemisiifolia TaxID=4212 RepID=A0AAD5CXB4_AMBAR|nr:hypothetical protein M8C21_020816 [Ambrosia artemisiifolia]